MRLVETARKTQGSPYLALYSDLAHRTEPRTMPLEKLSLVQFGTYPAIAIGGWIANHYFSTHRDKTKRRLDAIGFLLAFRTEIERASHKDAPGVWNCYRAHLAELSREVGPIKGDLAWFRRKKFERLLHSLGQIQTNAIYTSLSDHRAPVCRPIDDLVEFLE